MFVIAIIKIMASCGLSYQFSASTAAMSREELTAIAHTKFANLQLEPSIHQLVSGFKSVAINMLTKGNQSSNAASLQNHAGSSGVDWEGIVNRRHLPGPELKGIFYSELKSYLLSMKSAKVCV